MEENRNVNRNKFGKIIYSKSYYKNRIPYENNFNSNIIDSNKRTDKIIDKAKNTIADYKRHLNEEDYFNNEIFFDNQRRAQLIKFNCGQSDYRYFSPFNSEKDYPKNKSESNYFIDLKTNVNTKSKSNSSKKKKPINVHKSNQIENNNKYKKYFNILYNENSKINSDINSDEEINNLKKKILKMKK